jgi:hypothetical protein
LSIIYDKNRRDRKLTAFKKIVIRNYMMIQQLRKPILALTLVFTYNSPLLQTTLATLTFFLFFTFNLIFNPYARKGFRILNLAIEIAFLIIYCFYWIFVYLDLDQEGVSIELRKQKLHFGWYMFYIHILLIILIFVTAIGNFVLTWPSFKA